MWMIRAGRGFGKTRSYCEWLIERRLEYPRTYGAIGMPTLKELRGVAFDGESGLVACLHGRGMHEGVDYSYNRTLHLVTLANKSIIQGFSSEAPESGRGFQSHDLVIDEPGTFRDQHLPKDQQLYTNLKFGQRLPMPDGSPNREMVTGTPRRRAFVRELIAKVTELGERGLGVLTTGSTYDNAANLSESFLDEILAHSGTTLGEQEIEGKLLDDVEGALWRQAVIETARVDELPRTPNITVVAVDPAASEAPTADEVGIITVARCGRDAYVIADDSTRGLPDVWAHRVIDACEEAGTRTVVVEMNLVGGWMQKTIENVARERGMRLTFEGVRAGKGQTKEVRAEPVSGLYSGVSPRVHHVGDQLTKLEDEMTSWVPGQTRRSPNRIDALVWGVWFLLLRPAGDSSVAPSPGDPEWGDLPTTLRRR